MFLFFYFYCFVKGKKNEAQQYLIQENELVRQQSVLYQLFAHESEKNIVTAQSRVVSSLIQSKTKNTQNINTNTTKTTSTNAIRI